MYSSWFFDIFIPWWFAVVLIRLFVMFGSWVIMVRIVCSIWVKGVFVWEIIVVHPHRFSRALANTSVCSVSFI